MPSFEEEYSFRLTSNFTEGEQTGSFTVTPAAPGNHGPVRVCGTYHFAYEDATPYYSIGTTCYAWTHQPQEIQAKTLETLKNNVFNKIRFCISPSIMYTTKTNRLPIRLRKRPTEAGISRA